MLVHRSSNVNREVVDDDEHQIQKSDQHETLDVVAD